MMNDLLIRYAGLLTLPAAVAAVVISAELPHSPGTSADVRNVYGAAALDVRAPAPANRGFAWIEEDAIDPFADEDLDESAALEARLAAEDNLELV
jgi:hypothetical protein